MFGGYGADGDTNAKKYDEKTSKLANVTLSSDLNLPHHPFSDSFVLMDLFGSSKARLEEHKVTENTCYHDYDDVEIPTTAPPSTEPTTTTQTTTTATTEERVRDSKPPREGRKVWKYLKHVHKHTYVCVSSRNK